MRDVPIAVNWRFEASSSKALHFLPPLLKILLGDRACACLVQSFFQKKISIFSDVADLADADPPGSLPRVCHHKP